MRKYISQVDNENFVYPNSNLVEYDIEIIHEINNNCVNGTVSGFTISSVGSNILVTFSYTWNKNGSEPYVSNINGLLQVLSVHMMTPDKQYLKPWRCISGVTSEETGITTKTSSISITVTPSMMGVSSFINGIYTFEIRFIGRRCVFPVLKTGTISVISPTSTPSPTPTITSTSGIVVTPTPSSTGYPPGTTRTPTPTPSYTPTSTPLTPIYSYKLGYDPDSSTNSCNDYDPDNSDTFWSYCSPLDNGCYLYLVGDYPLSGVPPDGYYSNGTKYWYVVNGYMVGMEDCTFTPTPTPTPTQLGVGFGIYTGATYANSTLTCNANVYPSITVYLTAGDTIPTIGDYFYKDQYTTPGNTFVGNYNYYKVRRAMPTLVIYAIQIGPNGQIMDVITCP
jgi:hypothetical protein